MTDIAQTESPNVQRLAAEWIEITPPLDREQARIALALYRLLAEGEPVSPERLAEHLGLSAEKVRAALGAWPAVFYDDEGSVVAFWGLALGETKHRLEVDGRTLYAWCAPDLLFLPRVLGTDARIESTVPTTDEPISLVVRPDGIENVSREGIAVSIIRPSEGKGFDDNIISNFCHHHFFFPSEEAGRRWAKGREDMVILALEDGFELVRLWVESTTSTPP